MLASGHYQDMDLSNIKIMITPGGELLSLCAACGRKSNLSLGEWLDLGDVAKHLRHAPCGAGRPGVSTAPEVIRRFFAERTEVAAGRYVSMEELRAAFDAWPDNEGRYAEYSTFGRWARQVLPPEARVERRRLDDQRQNWVINLRLV